MDLWMTLLTRIEGRHVRPVSRPAWAGACGSSRLLDVTSLPPHCGRSLYTHPKYLLAQGIREVVLVPRHSDEGERAALFRPRGDHFVHLGRLDPLEEAEAHRLARIVISEQGAKYVIFEDVELVPGRVSKRLPSIKFRYHGNWRLEVAPGRLPMSGSRRRQMRKLARRLAKATGHEMRFEFGRARNEDIERVIRLNRAKIRQTGRIYHFSDEKLRALKAMCGEIGYQALLYCGDDLIAGDILCVAGTRGYVMVSGYDTAYEKYSPGLHAYLYAMTELQSLGCTEANYLWGDNPMKARLGADRRQLTTVAIAHRQWMLLSASFLKACSEYGIATVKDAVKRRIFHG